MGLRWMVFISTSLELCASTEIWQAATVVNVISVEIIFGCRGDHKFLLHICRGVASVKLK
jgi:hypothetical protein